MTEQSFEYKYDGVKWEKYIGKDAWELESKYDEIQTGTIKSDLMPFLK